MSILAPRVAESDSGTRRLTFHLFGRWPVAPSSAVLMLVCCTSIATAIAAPLLAWGMPLGEPYLDGASLAASYLYSLPWFVLAVAALLVLPLSIIVMYARVCTPPMPYDWEWATNAPTRIAMASTIVLPVPAVALGAAAVAGLAANPAMFPTGVAAAPAPCAWLFPGAILVSVIGLPTLWVVTYRRAMRSFRAAIRTAGPACSGCGYSLVGLRAGVCPECGQPTSSMALPEAHSPPETRPAV